MEKLAQDQIPNNIKQIAEKIIAAGRWYLQPITKTDLGYYLIVSEVGYYKITLAYNIHSTKQIIITINNSVLEIVNYPMHNDDVIAKTFIDLLNKYEDLYNETI